MDVNEMAENKQADLQGWDAKPIGTEEQQKLPAKDVLIEAYEKVSVTVKNKPIPSEKVSLHCKHPDQEGVIKISDVRYIEADKVETKALWLNLDSKGEISKGSALACLLAYYGAKTVKELVGKSVKTDVGARGYLCIKAY